MIRELTCGLGVGADELAADDDLVRPCPVEVAVGLVELAEEVADVVLGTRIQYPEVGGELHGSVPTEEEQMVKNQIRNATLIEKKTMTYPKRGWSGESRKSPRRCACCWPFILKERRLGFLDWKKIRQGKLWPMRRLQCRWGDL